MENNDDLNDEGEFYLCRLQKMELDDEWQKTVSSATRLVINDSWCGLRFIRVKSIISPGRTATEFY